MPIDNPLIGHVWVLYFEAGRAYLFDGTASPEKVIRPFDEVRSEYRPEYGVDRRGRRYAYAGAVLSLKERDAIPKHPSDAPNG